jgi:hypothetical protein
MDASVTHQGTLSIELIHPRSHDLAWRILHTDPDKIWKTADDNIKNAFKRCPSSPKDIEAKKKQWAREDTLKTQSQP